MTNINSMFAPSHIDIWYGQLVQHVLQFGSVKADRTGTGTFSVSGGSVRFDLLERAPILSLKKTNYQWAFDEMDWFISGDCSNIKYLQDRNVPIWNEWADEDGNVGPIYGCQWRHWKAPSKNDAMLRQEPREVDQLAILIDTLKTDPWSRRMIVEGWNPALLPISGVAPAHQARMGKMALPPCHKSFQCLVRQDGLDVRMDLILYIRSSDIFLGLPFNIAQYAYLAMMLARTANLKIGHLIVHFGDLHLYQNHVEQAHEVVDRWTKFMDDLHDPHSAVPSPQITFDPDAPLLPWDIDSRAHVQVGDYDPAPHIPAPVSV